MVFDLLRERPEVQARGLVDDEHPAAVTEFQFAEISASGFKIAVLQATAMIEHVQLDTTDRCTN